MTIMISFYLSASYRRDGTSRFNKNVRWGDFGSIGGSWRISQEPFMQDISWLNNLTLKASYGVQGNDNVGSLYAWQAFYSLEYPNGANAGAVVSSLENADLKWEKNENLNVGIEARLLDKISVSAEYYNRFTRDMLMDYPMALSLGFSGYSKNIGNMKNSGLELSVSMDVIKKEKFNWNVTLMVLQLRIPLKTLLTNQKLLQEAILLKREKLSTHSILLHLQV